MSISPPSDIIMDVARAVDPTTLAEAKQKLEQRAAAAGASFPVISASIASPPQAPFGSTGSAAATRPAEKAGAAQAYRRFEAVVLQSFLQDMMPKNTEAVYGEGLSGDMWKSLLARQLAQSLAERGGIGIAKRLLADHYALNGPGAAHLDQQALAGQRHLLSTGLVQAIQQRLDSTIGTDSTTAIARKQTI